MTTSTQTYSACASRAADVLVPAAVQGGFVVSRFHEEAKPNTSQDSILRMWILH